MQILIDLLEGIKEIAVVTAMNTAAGAFAISRPGGGTEQAKQQLMGLVNAEVKQNEPTIILSLDWQESVKVAPLYILFAGAWESPRVRESVLSFLRQAPALRGIQFDLELRKH